jgi:hypothetical protein
LAYTLNTATAGNLFVGTATTTPYSISGSNGYTNTAWATSVAPMTVTQDATITLNGDRADIVINGKSLGDTLSAIESRLAMLKPDIALETEWAELKRLGDEYRALEQEIKEKMKSWNILKKD